LLTEKTLWQGGRMRKKDSGQAGMTKDFICKH
jgi:hypothetical protein